MSKGLPLLTDQQKTAVDERRTSIVLSSGAGCGKTSVLTARYLSHLIRDGYEVGQMAAITFTDKAAREMRQRIREAIEIQFSAADNDGKSRWQRQLIGLETASISTIHSFCTQLLKRHSLATGLDPNFQVLEEAFAPNIREASLRQTLTALLIQQDDLGDSLRELVNWHGWWAVRKSIGELIMSRDQSKWKEWLKRPIQDIADRWQHYAKTHLLAVHWANWNATANKLVELLGSIESPNEKFAANAMTIKSDCCKLASRNDVGESFSRIREAAKVQHVVTKKSWKLPETYEIVSSTFKEVRELIDELLPILDVPTTIADTVRFGMKFLDVASACADAYQTEKRRLGYLDFDDLLVMARDLLKNRPDVRRECQQRYRVILVDELQDTDRVQMELVDLLCGSDKKKGKLFAVGDANQSIYRFRGADVAGFDHLRNDVPAEGQLSLSVNFRSQPGILRFANALLQKDLPNYQGLMAKVPQVTEEPCVEFLWGPADGNADMNRRQEAARIARRIARMINNQEEIVTSRPKTGAPTTRAVQLKDIVLLFRAMNDVAIYETALRDAGIDYYLVGGRAFFAQQEIYDILNLLRTLENPHDTLSLAGVMRSPFGCVSDESLYILAQHQGGLWKGLHDPHCLKTVPEQDVAAVQRNAHWLLQWRGVKDRLSITALINRVLADSGYDAALRYEPLGDRKLANLWKLLEQARTFDAAGSFTLTDFIKRLNELVTTQPREEQAATQPEESNVVRLMTIHQAKGLEFPVVFVPDLARDKKGPREGPALWDDEMGCVASPPGDEDPLPYPKWPRTIWNNIEKMADAQEELRVFYVACTRAMDYLVLSASRNSKSDKSNPAIELLASRFDLETGECKDKTISDEQWPEVAIGRDDPSIRGLEKRLESVVPTPLTARDAANVRAISA